MNVSQNAVWQVPPNHVSISPSDVHVWRVNLDQPDVVRHRLRDSLSGDELERADRFYFEKDRHHYTVGRGVLRNLLGHYLHLSPNKIRFAYGKNNKPMLTHDITRNDLRFNLSHSHGEALFAFSLGREMGVDIELIRSLDDAESIAKHNFSERDIATYLSLPAHQRDEGFFNCWTRKEAYIKALGDGLSHPLDTFDVTLRPGDPAELLAVRGDASELKRWSMADLNPVAGYAAALIVENDAENATWYLKCWDTGTEFQR